LDKDYFRRTGNPFIGSLVRALSRAFLKSFSTTC
jgi:hypothetical protein